MHTRVHRWVLGGTHPHPNSLARQGGICKVLDEVEAYPNGAADLNPNGLGNSMGV